MAPALLAALAGGMVVTSMVLLVVGLRRRPTAMPGPAAPPSRWRRRVQAVASAATGSQESRHARRRRIVLWLVIGAGVWLVTGWPVAGIAVAVTGIWLPWLLGSGRIAQERIDRLEALETWCRRMADTLTGGGAVGLAQAIAMTAPHVDPSIAPAVRVLAVALRDGITEVPVAMREFADALNDRVGDTVAAALLLALDQQSTGIARVLRQLADGVARDVRSRREIEAERAESRQSIKMLLLIQCVIFGFLALNSGFSAPYRTPVGQLVMAILLAGTVTLLVWMRRLALGRQAPRFLSGPTR